jgi:serine/threonine protein kinase
MVPQGGVNLSGSSLTRYSAHSDLSYQAFCLYVDLVEAGQTVEVDEFCARYPSVQDSLRKAIEAHALFEARPDLIGLGEVVAWPEPGEEFAGFQLIRELGRGAFARVFQATEPALGHRQVALKVSDRGCAEAATLGPIAHPNIVPVFSIAEDQRTGLSGVCMPYLGEATLFTVLDYLYGRPATPITSALPEDNQHPPVDSTRGKGERRQRTQNHPVPSASCLPSSILDMLRRGDIVDCVRQLAVQLADGLAFIHTQGICHRDLKPTNVLVGPDGAPMLLDFNQAADVQGPPRSAAGTPTYMSPEHLRAALPGETVSEQPDARSDLFSFGVIFYELLTGSHPFQPFPPGVKGVSKLFWLLSRQPQGFRPIREIRPDVDKAFADVVEQCLALDPADRPKSAAAIVRVLRRSQARRARLSRWLIRRRKAVALVCLFLVATTWAYIATRPPADIAEARLGRDAFEQRDFQSAVHHFSESLRANPKQPEVLFARGRGYVRLAAADDSHYILANADFTRAAQLALEKKFKGWCNAYLAYCLQKETHIAEAIVFYELALKQGMRTAEVYNNLAHLYLDTSRLQDAHKSLELALQLNPKLSVAHYNQAVLCYQQALKADGQPEEQKGFLEEGITHFLKAEPPLTGLMTLTGAMLFARAAAFDEHWSDFALKYLATATDQGVPPKQWHSQSAFTRLKGAPAYQALLSRKPPANSPSTTAIRDVEPTRD